VIVVRHVLELSAECPTNRRPYRPVGYDGQQVEHSGRRERRQIGAPLRKLA
jgi:hypothetical protein